MNARTAVGGLFVATAIVPYIYVSLKLIYTGYSGTALVLMSTYFLGAAYAVGGYLIASGKRKKQEGSS